MNTFQHPPKLPLDSKRKCAAILWDLHLRGPVVDPGGAAISVFADRLAEIGWDMPQASIKRIVDGLGDRGGQHGDMYPYNYIAREINGKRTLSISLIVDPDKVPFPPNPFQNRPAFIPVPTHRGTRNRFADPGPVKADEGEGETFARQRQFDDVVESPASAPAVAEPDPQPEPEPEPEDLVDDFEPIATELEVGTLEPFEAEPTVQTNGAGDEFEQYVLPDDFLTELEDDNVPPRSAMDMVSAAISLLSDAMAAHAGEQTQLAADTLDRHIDARLGEYRVLQERLEQTEAKLRHAVAQYERVVEVARKQREQLIALRKVARPRAKSPMST